ncbi:hypothetical protein [Paraglaciecola hydrolytica]|uniref:Uncharacterized protein n=1 Tax=Paraglaciecola hydrolytica TaxID=1799789 RepID=A0A135ZYX7_9ALTE|nr:hypothetical protein [Paraglaciecola hydrolytica]KXI28080.1 hypothetical protein AX660_16980 [Paraglaciecola hydrolytica]
MNKLKNLGLMALLLTSLAGMTACEDNNAEELGEKLDKTVTDAGNAVEDACEEVKEGVDAKDTDC